MDAFQFIKDCVSKCKNGKKIRESFQPHKGKEKRKHAKVGFKEYAFDSNPGFGHLASSSDGGSTSPVVMGTSTVGTSGPVADIGMGSGDAGGAACCASVGNLGIDAIIESFEKEHPSENVVSEIRQLFENVKKGQGILYHGCDGMATPKTESANPAAIDNAQLSALAASCEAALNAFKNYTGFDYLSLRK